MKTILNILVLTVLAFVLPAKAAVSGAGPGTITVVTNFQAQRPLVIVGDEVRIIGADQITNLINGLTATTSTNMGWFGSFGAGTNAPQERIHAAVVGAACRILIDALSADPAVLKLRNTETAGIGFVTDEGELMIWDYTWNAPKWFLNTNGIGMIRVPGTNCLGWLIATNFPALTTTSNYFQNTKQPAHVVFTNLAAAAYVVTNVSSANTNFYSLLKTTNQPVFKTISITGGTITDQGTNLLITVVGGGGTNTLTISSNGVAFASTTNLNFVGFDLVTNVDGTISIGAPTVSPGGGGGPSTNYPTHTVAYVTTNIVVDVRALSATNSVKITLTQNSGLLFTNVPVQPVELTIELLQDSTGNRIVVTNSPNIRVGPDVTGILQSTNAAYVDFCKWRSRGTNMWLVGSIRGGAE